jgi:hypothetical protein
VISTARGILPADLLARLQPDPPDGPAVYFLFRADVCVYIGASVNARGRVHFHRTAGRDFDRAAYLPVSNDRLAAAERQWIAAVCPVHNRRDNPELDKGLESWGNTLKRRKPLPPPETVTAVAAIVASISAEMERRGVNSLGLSVMADLPASTVWRLFSGDRADPALSTVVRLAEALGMTVALVPPAPPPAPKKGRRA